MRGRTFALSQKELQRVSVISSCAKGDMACARAAELLSLSVRQVKRLKKRLREQGEAALAHAMSRTAQPPPAAGPGTPSHRSPSPLHLCRLQRSPPLRKTLRGRGLLPQPRNPPTALAEGRSRLAPQAPRSRSSSAPSAIRSRGRTGPTGWLAPRLAG